MTSAASIPAQKQSISVLYMVGTAALFVCCAWLAQATTFPEDAKSATVLWTLMASTFAGFGAALMYVARCWLKAT